MYRAASVLLLLLCSPPGWAERAILSGELGLWLSQTAIPELTESLARHPKFSGEPIRIAAVDGSQASTRSSLLADAIRQQLTHAILRKGKNNVANNQDPTLCNRIPKPIYYLVGIRIEPLSRSDHRISLAVMDLETSMWVSGISLTWQGRLLNSERAALAALPQNGPVGSLENPIAFSAIKTLTEALYAQVQCRLPQNLNGTLSATKPKQQDLQLVLHDLQERLALSAQPVSSDPQQADWLLHADLQQVTDDLQLLTLNLQPQGAPNQAQRLASMYVSGTRQLSATASLPVNPASALLSELSIPTTTRQCRSGECAEIEVDLYEDAYLLVFRTYHGQVEPLFCGQAISKKSAGIHRYRLQTMPEQRVGFYVIASRERQVARTLQRQLGRAPGACNQPPANNSNWLPSTLAKLTNSSTAIEWRALHVINTAEGPQLL